MSSLLESFLREVRVRALLHACARVGPGVGLEGTPLVRAEGAVEIGAGVRIDSMPVRARLLAGERGMLRIGDGVRICTGAAISARLFVEVGRGAQVGPFAVVSDAGPGTLRHLARPVSIGDHALLGAHVTVLPGAHVGHGAEVLAGSVVDGRLPPLCIAGGAPARPLHSGDDSCARTDVRVRLLLQELLGLEEPPRWWARRKDLPAWNDEALSALIEERLSVHVPPAQLARLCSLPTLAAAIDAARRGEAPAATSASPGLPGEIS